VNLQSTLPSYFRGFAVKAVNARDASVPAGRFVVSVRIQVFKTAFDVRCSMLVLLNGRRLKTVLQLACSPSNALNGDWEPSSSNFLRFVVRLNRNIFVLVLSRMRTQNGAHILLHALLLHLGFIVLPFKFTMFFINANQGLKRQVNNRLGLLYQFTTLANRVEKTVCVQRFHVRKIHS